MLSIFISYLASILSKSSIHKMTFCRGLIGHHLLFMNHIFDKSEIHPHFFSPSPSLLLSLRFYRNFLLRNNIHHLPFMTYIFDKSEIHPHFFSPLPLFFCPFHCFVFLLRNNVYTYHICT